MAPDAASPFSGVLVMPKYEESCKKESEFFAGFFVLLVQIIFCFSWKDCRKQNGQQAESQERQQGRSSVTKSVRACTTQTDSVRFMPRL